MSVRETPPRTLSAAESRVMLALEWRGQRKVTGAELKEMLGGSDGNARVVAHRLVKKGWLEPVTRGVFLVVPADRGPEGISDTNPLALGADLAAEYFYSFGTACSFHHLTEQAFTTVYLVCRQARASVTVRDTRYSFVAVPADRFFGFELGDVLGTKVQMADLERSVLDSIDRPNSAGGIGEVSRIVRHAAKRISWPRLVAHVERWRESALVQRLGYLLDVHAIPVDVTTRTQLRDLVRPDNKIFFGPRKRWGTSGKLVAEWGIIENVPRDVLVERGDGARRPLRLPKRVER
jgi:predicted transcriptional regulator of viral defense system